MALLSAWAVLALGEVSTVSPVSTGLTPCQQCCAPGGDCTKAFKGGAGKCCGTLNGQAFCCPGGYDNGQAKCYQCATSYRCFTGAASLNICGPSSPMRHTQPRYYSNYRHELKKTPTGV